MSFGIVRVQDLIGQMEELMQKKKFPESVGLPLLHKYYKMDAEGIESIEPVSITLGEEKRPWSLPGYQGKLRSTPSVFLEDYPPPNIDDLIEMTIQMMLDEEINEALASRLLKNYDKLKKDGHIQHPR